MEFCEREELYCRSSPDVFFFADNSKFKTQSVVQLPPSALTVSQVFRSQVPQSCLRRHCTLLLLVLIEVLVQEGLFCLLPV